MGIELGCVRFTATAVAPRPEFSAPPLETALGAAMTANTLVVYQSGKGSTQ